jgi:DNA methylase
MMTKTLLNGICPYFTMFPLDFPNNILRRKATHGEWVMDPFCGRGTTNYASRMLGLPSIGIDSSPVAVALSQAKLANTTPESIIATAREILAEVEAPQHMPDGEFWEWAFDANVLYTLCCLREGLMARCDSDSRKALRAILLGALHGPRGKTRQSYFSNQSQRTYAPKPAYAIKFWRSKELRPPDIDVMGIIKHRAHRYYSGLSEVASGIIIQGDSRLANTYVQFANDIKVSWVLTSPPYYGMRTYLPDQWLRLWFVGGSANVDYSTNGQIEHTSPSVFANELKQVWQNTGSLCKSGARLIIRFGAINDRKAEPLPILKESLKDTGWKIQTRKSAGYASEGRRQALHISKASKRALEEYDIWAIWQG